MDGKTTFTIGEACVLVHCELCAVIYILKYDQYAFIT